MFKKFNYLICFWIEMFELKVLAFIYRKEKDGIQLPYGYWSRELANVLGMHPQQIREALRNLERLEYIEVAYPGHRRTCGLAVFAPLLVYLTEKGRKEVENLRSYIL